MPLPPEIIAEDIHSFVLHVFLSVPNILQKDMKDLYEMFISMYYPLSLKYQQDLENAISAEMLNRFCQYETALVVHKNYTIQDHQGTYYKMDPESESGYFVTTNAWYIVEHTNRVWIIFPTDPRIILENNGITRIYE